MFVDGPPLTCAANALGSYPGTSVEAVDGQAWAAGPIGRGPPFPAPQCRHLVSALRMERPHESPRNVVPGDPETPRRAGAEAIVV